MPRVLGRGDDPWLYACSYPTNGRPGQSLSRAMLKSTLHAGDGGQRDRPVEARHGHRAAGREEVLLVEEAPQHREPCLWLAGPLYTPEPAELRGTTYGTLHPLNAVTERAPIHGDGADGEIRPYI